MAKEYTIPEKLKLLYELQLIDTEIDQIKILKGELPMEVLDLEDEITGLGTRISRMQRNVSDLEGDIARHFTNIQEAEALIERYTKQMDNVKNNREYDALTKELELQKLEIQLSEKKIREAKAQMPAKEETLKATQERYDHKKEDLEVKKVELEKIILKTEKDEEKLKKKSTKKRKQVEERLLESYDRVRSRYRNGLSVVHVARNSCGGCFNKIPPQLHLELGLRKKIIACEHCGRILVDDDILMVGKEPKPEKA